MSCVMFECSNAIVPAYIIYRKRKPPDLRYYSQCNLRKQPLWKPDKKRPLSKQRSLFYLHLRVMMESKKRELAESMKLSFECWQ